MRCLICAAMHHKSAACSTQAYSRTPHAPACIGAVQPDSVSAVLPSKIWCPAHAFILSQFISLHAFVYSTCRQLTSFGDACHFASGRTG